MAGYLGSTPVPQATQHRESFTATEGQTSFATAGYTPQFLDVFLNGSHLSPADFVAIMRLVAGPEHLRPGGYISGPTQMSMADSVTYMAIFTKLGITPMTVTSNLNMNFLRPCIGEAVTAEANLLKLGRTLAVAEVEIRAEGSDKVASHAIVTYSIPREA